MKKKLIILMTILLVIFVLIVGYNIVKSSTMDKIPNTKEQQSKITTETKNDEDDAGKTEKPVTEVKQDTKTYSNSNKNNSSSNKGNSSSGSSNSGSSNSGGSTKPSHTHSWNKHYATGYKTETYYETVYRCTHGNEFSSLEAAEAHSAAMFEKGDPCGYNAFDVPRTHQVPYQYVDYYYCSCGATK